MCSLSAPTSSSSIAVESNSPVPEHGLSLGNKLEALLLPILTVVVSASIATVIAIAVTRFSGRPLQVKILESL